ncbi:MAG TPA: Rrf2 family transcriptional regulator [Gemmataceae bacterium]|nr:Rrf2 family transcriptional regulator [Gemmataceae bacterium]
MKLTLASVYALHALAYVAGRKHDRPSASHHIARAQGLPERFLLKVLKTLAAADPPILTSTKGPGGGYRLARPASDITLLEVLEAVDRPVRGLAPAPHPHDGRKPLDKALHKRVEAACQGAADVVRKHLEGVRVSDFVGKGK